MSNLSKTNESASSQSNFKKTDLFQQVKSLIDQSRRHVKKTIDSTITQTYWNIGRIVIDHEQKGESRAEYGKKILESLAIHLSELYGKGFDVTNLRNMRRFYLAFTIQETVSLELSWSHHVTLLRIKDEKARAWYTKETIENNWSVRALGRQVSKLYYERLLASQDKKPVIEEAKENTKTITEDSRNYLRDPYILDFLNVPNTGWLESKLESAQWFVYFY